MSGVCHRADHIRHVVVIGATVAEDEHGATGASVEHVLGATNERTRRKRLTELEPAKTAKCDDEQEWS
jgi:hypothetical protein